MPELSAPISWPCAETSFTFLLTEIPPEIKEFFQDTGAFVLIHRDSIFQKYIKQFLSPGSHAARMVGVSSGNQSRHRNVTPTIHTFSIST